MLSRQHPRHAVELPVTLTGDHNGEGLLTYLSLGGGRIERADAHIERRAVLTLTVYLSAQESPVIVDVAWC